MKFVVVVKEVPSTEAKIELRDGRVDLSGVQMVVNPYDEYAVEEALKQAEAAGGSTVTAVMVGGEASRKNLTNVLALGADDAILISDPALADADPLQLAKALAAAIRPLDADVVLAGRQGVDCDWGLTGIALAAGLGWAHAGLISRLELSGGSFRCESEGDDGTLVTEGALPALFTVDKGINEPRYASLKGIMAAKKKPVADATLASLGLSADSLGASGVQQLGAQLPPQRQGGRVIDGASVPEKVATLIGLLRTEAKVI